MKEVLKGASFRAVYLAGKRSRDSGITILSYHSLDDYGTGISVSPALFAAQMKALTEEGCCTFTMAQVAAHLASRRPFPPRSIAITFDDGFANVATVALPIMQRYRLNGTVFIITGMIGRRTDWIVGGQPLPSLPMLTWEEIEHLHHSGMEIGGHTIAHDFLTRCRPEQLRRELRQKGLARAHQFSWEQSIRRVRDIYGEVIGASAAVPQPAGVSSQRT